MKTILFTGGSSLLAQTWIKENDPEFNYILGLHKRELNQNKFKTIFIQYDSVDKIKKQINKLNVDVIINCIGLTNVEDCEKTPELAEKVNKNIPKNIARACFECKIKFVQISTDHLFEGNSSYYSETVSCNPINVYGITKAQGEKAVLDVNPRALIIRTNFFGSGPSYKASFSDKILHNLDSGVTSNLFDDVYYTPVSVSALRKMVITLLKKKGEGVFNISSNERLTKYQFGMLLAKTYGYPTSLIKPISINEVPNLISRPKDMSLSNYKLCSYLGLFFPSIKEQISELKQEQFKNKKRHVIPYGRQDISEIDIKKLLMF